MTCRYSIGSSSADACSGTRSIPDVATLGGHMSAINGHRTACAVGISTYTCTRTSSDIKIACIGSKGAGACRLPVYG